MPTDEPSGDDWMTVAEAAAELGVSHWTLRAWMRRKTGPDFYRVGEQTLRFRRADVIAYRESRRVAS